MFTKFEELWEAVEQFKVDKNIEQTIVTLKNDGKPISLLDRDLMLSDGGGLYYILDDGTLIKQSLYVSDEDVNRLKSLNPINQDELPKYHIYNCGTLKELKSSKYSKNYKMSIRDDGTFHFVFTDNNNVIKEVSNQKLHICESCLRIYNRVKNQNFVANNFSLQKFFENYITCFSGLNIDSLEYSTYYKESETTRDWHYISSKMKEKRKYTCERCGFVAKNTYQRKFIHTHHIPSTSMSYSKFDKLKVLCIYCHSQEHENIKESAIYKEFVDTKK